MPNESHGVGQGIDPTIAGSNFTNGRIERSEEGVLNEYSCTSDSIHQRGLTGIGVTSDCNSWNIVLGSLLTLGVARNLHLFNLFAELRHLVIDPTTIGLDLGLTRSAAANSTSLTRERITPTTKSREHITHLRQLYLGFTLTRFSMLSEDIENECGAIDHLHLKF